MDSPQNQPPQEARLHFLDYWRIIRIRKAIIITVFLITAIIATVVTYWLPLAYSSTAEIVVKPDKTDLTVSGQQGSDDYNPFFLNTELEIIKGPTILDKVIDALKLNEVWGKKSGVGTLKTSETLQYLQSMIALNPIRNTSLVDITVYSGDKDEAATIANQIANTYHDYRIDRNVNLRAGGIKKLEEKFADEEQQILAAQTNVDTLRKDLGIVDYDPNSYVPTPTLSQDELRQDHEQMMQAETTYNGLKTQLEQLKALSPEKLRDALPRIGTPDSTLNDLLGKLNEAEQKFVTLTNDYSPANPLVISARSSIVKLNQQINDSITGIMVALENNMNTKKAELEAMTENVEAATKKDRDEAVRGAPYWQAKRELANLNDQHKTLAAKIDNEIIESKIPTTTLVEITKIAEPGKAPVLPHKTLNISLGLIFGLIVGLGLAFFIEYLDTSVKTIDDVERAFQAPVLGVIPQDVGILIDEGPESRYAEAYRVLRTNILFARKNEKFSTVVVVSAGAGEGKSTTTLNLATVFAQAGQRVLVVDSDLRRPTLHKLLHVANDLGLTNYLLNQNALEEVIQTTAVPTLNFMASGKLPSSSMSILNSAQMKEMIADLQQRYDFIFFDSPPILGVSDASVLASEVNLVVQVIQYRRYPQPMNLRAKQVIEKVGGTFLGIVLNNINMSQDESYYYYSGYYQDYYASGDSKETETAASKNPDNRDQTGIKQKY